MSDSRVTGLRVAFVGHSRGGLVARAFLNSAATTPALVRFMRRVTTLITLHAPNLGSGVANLAGTVAGLLTSLTTALTALAPTPVPFLSSFTAMISDPAIAELAVGSPAIAGLTAGEPVPGVAYHTFGGTSPVFTRLWASLYTPDSGILIPLPIPVFHWGSTPVTLGGLIDTLSLAGAAAVLAPVPP